VSIDRWTGKENGVYIHNAMLFNLKEENSVTWDDVDGTGENYAKWSKPGRDKEIMHIPT
jgi:hypothetical protein